MCTTASGMKKYWPQMYSYKFPVNKRALKKNIQRSLYGVCACETGPHLFKASKGLTEVNIFSQQLKIATRSWSSNTPTVCNLFTELKAYFNQINNERQAGNNMTATFRIWSHADIRVLIQIKDFSDCRSFDLARAASTARAKRLPSLVREHSSMAARHFFAVSGSRLSLTYNRERRPCWQRLYNWITIYTVYECVTWPYCNTGNENIQTAYRPFLQQVFWLIIADKPQVQGVTDNLTWSILACQ